ncbi:hypothetical protein D3C85_785410 [compost metagenome]
MLGPNGGRASTTLVLPDRYFLHISPPPRPSYAGSIFKGAARCATTCSMAWSTCWPCPAPPCWLPRSAPPSVASTCASATWPGSPCVARCCPTSFPSRKTPACAAPSWRLATATAPGVSSSTAMRSAQSRRPRPTNCWTRPAPCTTRECACSCSIPRPSRCCDWPTRCRTACCSTPAAPATICAAPSAGPTCCTACPTAPCWPTPWRSSSPRAAGSAGCW